LPLAKDRTLEESLQNDVRSVVRGKESTVDEEQQRRGLAPSPLSSVTLTLLATAANDNEL